jgi:hypothetical protein
MGIGFAHFNRPPGHHCPQWAYGGFNRFRVRLAASEGFDLDEMQGFSNGDYFGDNYVPGTRSWDEITTPLKPLLNHSDCDGELTPEECAQVAPRLREVAASWSVNGVTMSDAFDYQGALALAECMEVCAAGNEQLLFR